MITALPQTAILQRLRVCLPRLAFALAPENPLASLGLDSIETVELLCTIHEEFGVRFTETEFAAAETVGDLLHIIQHRTEPNQP